MSNDNHKEHVSRKLVLPAHVWQFLEKKADSETCGNIELAVIGMYHDARTYQAMVSRPARRSRKSTR